MTDEQALEKAFYSEQAAALLDELRSSAAEMLSAEREDMSGFVERNAARWGPALDAIETLLKMASEAPDCAPSWRADNGMDTRLAAVLQLHVRAWLVATEAVWLVRGGFADGALSRWRSLHELTVVAVFLANSDVAVSERFYASAHFTALKRAYAYNEQTADEDEKFGAAELSEMERQCAALRAVHGDLRAEHDWAAPELARRLGKSSIGRVTFAMLEDAVGMAHVRPFYRWACDHVHAGPKEPRDLLGSSEMLSHTNGAGPSNSGMAEPLGLIAAHLGAITQVVLSLMPCIEARITSEAVSKFSLEVATIALETQRQTLRRARWARKARNRKG